ncbi:MAG: hypothetical protein NC344_09080 [Bacteroidales bacterium]|nr:hypothetical protein [Bacteroidales bacterium]MCM1147962.1 hypothetical protein [Bacteroidales bacterium]MCM1206886.1 hypothetical protein [Bacillota bacterium]MCM1509519.1 hypothetical protein [Clostridium sp.]
MSKSSGVMMLLGGLVMVVCTGLLIVSRLMTDCLWASVTVKIVPWIYIIGAVVYVIGQRMEMIRGGSLTLGRLYSIQLLSGVCFIVAGFLMVENVYHFLQPLVVSNIDSYFTYVRFIHNNWVVLLLVGAVLQIYTTHRISYELRQ